MTDSGAGAQASGADSAAELAVLRARVSELEAQLRSRPPTPRTPAHRADAAAPRGAAPMGLMKAAIVALGGMVALMIVPTILSLRRMVRWWRY